jgi:hypothetical protein
MRNLIEFCDSGTPGQQMTNIQIGESKKDQTIFGSKGHSNF